MPHLVEGGHIFVSVFHVKANDLHQSESGCKMVSELSTALHFTSACSIDVLTIFPPPYLMCTGCI